MHAKRRPVLIPAATLLLVCSCSTARVTLSPAPAEDLGLSSAGLARVDSTLQAYVDSGRLPGVVAMIARGGRIGYQRAFGWMDIDARVPMRSDAVFRIYSMTKPVLAAGAMTLVEDGRLNLEDPVSDYIPAFADVKVYAGGSAASPVLTEPDSVVTVRHLLTHTAGLGYGIGDAPVDTLYQRAALFDPYATLEQFADSIAQLPLYFSPGTSFKYSAAIDVLGRVIEVASGRPLDEFLEAQIFTPLGMRHTSFRRGRDLDARMTTLYTRGANGRLTAVTDALSRMYEPDARFFWGGGGLLSTPHDYLRFAQMLLNGGELNGHRVLDEQSVAVMMRNHLPAALTPLGRPPMMDEGYGYGLAGAVLVDTSRATLPGPEGIYRWSGYVGTYFWIDPVNDLIGMVWTQFTPGRTYPLEQEFQRLVYAALVH
ncbi:MAG TPA: serine hydrolase domain-containing protein [Longimicrobiales bacterium]|nr:serine hydrolase domain-containing protein [Longimicrobiales bacterium]